jgi:hypothetical protein
VIYLNKQKSFYCSDEICGKETADYINEFSPHRLSIIRFEEDSEEISDADEEKTVVKR